MQNPWSHLLHAGLSHQTNGQGSEQLDQEKILEELLEKICSNNSIEKMSFKQQHQYNFVEDNLPDLRPRYTKCNIIPMMITKCILLINSAFENGFKNKLGYFIRTIPDTSTLLLPIEDIIRNRFILAMTSRCI